MFFLCIRFGCAAGRRFHRVPLFGGPGGRVFVVVGRRLDDVAADRFGSDLVELVVRGDVFVSRRAAVSLFQRSPPTATAFGFAALRRLTTCWRLPCLRAPPPSPSPDANCPPSGLPAGW